jgi:prepilin-type N-terminal cleavage/methylation domain-containing protein
MVRGIRNEKGFTLVEIMMVVIIIGILAVLAIPRYQKYLMESKLSEVQVNIGEIKQGEAKYYNAHGNKYKAIKGVDEIEKLLRIELGAKTNFDYEIGTYGSTDGASDSKGYVIKAFLTDAGQEEFNLADAKELWFIYPVENRPRDATDTTKYAETWEKGWNDEEFFDPAADVNIADVTEYDADGNVVATHTVNW